MIEMSIIYRSPFLHVPFQRGFASASLSLFHTSSIINHIIMNVTMMVDMGWVSCWIDLYLLAIHYRLRNNISTSTLLPPLTRRRTQTTKETRSTTSTRRRSVGTVQRVRYTTGVPEERRRPDS